MTTVSSGVCRSLRPGQLSLGAVERLGRDEVPHFCENLDGTGTLKAPKNDQERVVVLPPARRR